MVTPSPRENAKTAFESKDQTVPGRRRKHVSPVHHIAKARAIGGIVPRERKAAM